MWLRWFAWLPLPVLYRLADLMSWIVCYVVRYRRAVVQANLTRAFPEKSLQEINKITRTVYRNIADVFVETIKAYRMRPEELRRRVQFKNLDLLDEFIRAQQSIIVLATHQANWEWLLLAASAQIDWPVAAIYRPIHQPSYDRLMLQIRSRFGASLVPANLAFMRLLRARKAAKMIVAVADQSPVEGDEKHWVHCLNQDTPFAVGMEKMARLLKCPVFFIRLQRERRGYYLAEFVPLAEPPYVDEGYPLIERYSQLFVQQLQRAPGDWLWTNRRWKYRKPVYAS